MQVASGGWQRLPGAMEQGAGGGGDEAQEGVGQNGWAMFVLWVRSGCSR